MTPQPPSVLAKAPDIPGGPFLRQLAGMNEARTWSEALVYDLAQYKEKRLAWSEIDQGCLFYGPPGTGKTTLARAIAATARVPLIATSYADWTRGQYVSDVIAPMRRSFDVAASHAPCILAIDEIDSLPKREGLPTSHTGTHMIVNALLELLDGFNRRPGVVVIGTCNHPEGLDPALVRPGRLDRRIHVPLPDLAALPMIIGFHLGDDAKEIGDLSALAIPCVGMSGAAVEQLVRDARRHARRNGRPLVRDDIYAVFDVAARSRDSETQRRIAVHESGHAVAAYRLKTATSIALSIVAQKDTGGRTVYTSPNTPLTRETLALRLSVLLAGRAAEQVLLGTVSAGAGGEASSDLAQATDLALAAIVKFGLSEAGSLLWQPLPASPTLSLYPAHVIKEVEDLLASAYENAKGLIEKNSEFVDRVAGSLASKRALAFADFVQLDPLGQNRTPSQGVPSKLRGS